MRAPEEQTTMSNPFTRRPSRSGSAYAWLWTERVAWAAGIAALGVWVAASASGAVGARRELQRFAALKSGALHVDSAPDQRLWSPERVLAWSNTRSRESPPPLAVLRIPRLELVVPVLEGTDEWTLNRAVGHIQDTAAPGKGGNSGIAGHRDGFFRGLKDIQVGDRLDIETIGRVESYRVERTWVVAPEDVSVLDPTATPSVTLVTCFPFYFIGSAPQRFIVRAVRTETTASRQAE
jgi:sortase A